MPEPTASEALTALADELDSLAADLGAMGHDYAKAADLARNRARKLAETAAEPSVTMGEGPDAGEPDGELRDAAPIVVTRDELLADWRKAHPGACSCPPDLADPSCPQHGGCHPARGDETEVWLKSHRDQYDRYEDGWTALDNALDDYRLHADTGSPLNAEIRLGDTP